MFRPKEIIFIPTTKCNLHCTHCFVTRTNAEYDVGFALSFIEDCARHGVERVGFSGGEPFLNLGFVEKVCQKVVDLDLYFGRIMTNAVWWKTENDLSDKLNALFDSGFDGEICISLDKFHNQDLKKVRTFIDTAINLGQPKDLISFASVRDGEDETTKKMLKYFAQYELKTDRIDYVPADFTNKKFWQAKSWLKDDFCKGPGNVFYVHNNGDISACCGYANEEPELIIGNIVRDNYESLMKNAEEKAILKIAYGGKFGLEIKKYADKVPGITDNHCLFCRWLIEESRALRQAQ